MADRTGISWKVLTGSIQSSVESTSREPADSCAIAGATVKSGMCGTEEEGWKRWKQTGRNEGTRNDSKGPPIPTPFWAQKTSARERHTADAALEL